MSVMVGYILSAFGNLYFTETPGLNFLRTSARINVRYSS